MCLVPNVFSTLLYRLLGTLDFTCSPTGRCSFGAVTYCLYSDR
jgi:hypothetical protein